MSQTFALPPLVDARRRLGDLLQARGYVTREQIDRSLRDQFQQGGDKLLGEVLIERGYCTEEQVLECVAEEMGLPFARLTDHLCDVRAVERIPREFLEKHTLLPLFVVRDVLTVAVADGTNVFLLDRLRDLSGCEVQAVMASSGDIRRTLHAYVAQPGADSGNGDPRDGTGGRTPQRREQPASLGKPADTNPAMVLVQNLLEAAVREGATDVHLDPTERSLRVRFRLDGVLREHQQLPRRVSPAMTDRIRTLAGLGSPGPLAQEGRMQAVVLGRTVDVCVQTMPVVHGEKLTLKILDAETVQFSLDRLGFSSEILHSIQRQLAEGRGLGLVTGPLGSGKATTLYAALQSLCNTAVNVCTIEDPVEFRLPLANQSQVDEREGASATSLLRSLLRQDADVIMVSRLQHRETLHAAVQAALGGTLLLASLQTSDTCGAIGRLRDMGVENYQLAAALNMVLTQRLCRRICSKCRKPYEPSRTTLQAVERMGFKSVSFQRGAGCDHCRQTGYKGRIGIHELLVVDDELRELLSAGAPLTAIRTHVQSRGMLCLRYDGLCKAREGLTTPEEVLRVADEGWPPQRRTAAGGDRLG